MMIGVASTFLASIAYILLIITSIDGAQRFNSFGRFGFLDGKVCPAGERVFITRAHSLLHCAGVCMSRRECRSFAYKHSSSSCCGCPYVSNGRGLDEESDNIYFIRKDEAVVLAGNSSLYTDRGLALVWHAGQWGTICDDNWVAGDPGYTGHNVGVLCNTLGLNSSGSFLGRAFSLPITTESDVPIWIDDMACLGTESHIQECPFRGFGNQNCGHGEDVSVQCF